MRFLFLAILTFGAAPHLHGQWQIEDKSPIQDPTSPLIFERKTVNRPGSGGLFSTRRIDFVWFNSANHTFKVIDNQGGPNPAYPTLEAAMEAHHCLAGANGGFFLKNYDPSGLMIAGGNTIGTFGSGGLLSGVLLSSGNRNPYVLRRSEYNSSKYKPTDLIQTGPFLVDHGMTVKGLSPENPRRRTFVLHDGGKWFGLGISDSFTLAELGEILGNPALSPGRKIHRALNLDGGTSSGFYLAPSGEDPPFLVEPFKTVRNFVGIVPR